MWHETVRKCDKIHPLVRMEAVLFNRSHPEHEHGYIKPKRTTFYMRALQDRKHFVDWNILVAAIHTIIPIIGMATVLQHLSPNH